MNTYEKTDEQKKRLSESIFNSTITENNTPINAIRRVVLKKKKKHKVPVAPGINGVIHEEPEGEEDEEEYEEVEVRDADIYQQPALEERNDAQVSSDEENRKEMNAPGSKLKPDLAAKHSDDSDDDKKDSKKKDKKDKKKKEDKPKGYNDEELKRGTKLMSNPNFKSNLDRLNRLKSQFKEKTQTTGQPATASTTSAPKLKLKVPPTEETAARRQGAVEEVMQESKVIQQEEYRFEPVEEPRAEFQMERGSDIKLGDRDQPQDLGKNGLKSFAGRGLKDPLKVSKQTPLITPNVNPDPVPTQKKPDSVQLKAAPEKEPKQKLSIQEKQAPGSYSQEDFDVPVDDSKPSLSSKAQSSTKDSSAPQDDWGVEAPGPKDPQPKKLTIPSKQPGVTLGKPGISLSTAQKKLVPKAPKADGSDNSWDKEKNPYE